MNSIARISAIVGFLTILIGIFDPFWCKNPGCPGDMEIINAHNGSANGSKARKVVRHCRKHGPCGERRDLLLE